MNDGPRRSSRRSALLAALAGAAVLLGGLGYRQAQNKLAPAQSTEQPQKIEAERYISLSPAITDTLITLQLGDQIVGISDYCHWPIEAPARVGSAITPSYERIAHLGPTRIFAPETARDQLAPLRKLAETTSLKWLTVEDMTQAIVELGEQTHRQAAALKLSRRLHSHLSKPAPPGAPRVLLALDYGDTGSTDTWFIRKNSIHGAILRAAGGRNAVGHEVQGPPKLSPEQLLKTDPDMIVILRSQEPQKNEQAEALAHFSKFAPLQAVKTKRVRVLSLPGSLSVGPSVVSTIAPLSDQIDALTRLNETP